MKVKIVGNHKVQVHTRVILFGIACLTILEIVALLQGINGTMLMIVIAVIAGAIGVVIPTPKWVKQ